MTAKSVSQNPALEEWAKFYRQIDTELDLPSTDFEIGGMTVCVPKRFTFTMACNLAARSRVFPQLYERPDARVFEALAVHEMEQRHVRHHEHIPFNDGYVIDFGLPKRPAGKCRGVKKMTLVEGMLLLAFRFWRLESFVFPEVEWTARKMLCLGTTDDGWNPLGISIRVEGGITHLDIYPDTKGDGTVFEGTMLVD